MQDESTRPLSVAEWFWAILILALPLINVVMYLYWAFADGVNLNKRNFCRASLLWLVVGMTLATFIAMTVGGFAALMSGRS